ncbi:hypothetical protein HDU90_007185 [Geranomyces variabilis]|nr:hypothetical protein HDU90_007185 [Geranomyces variabilis]
MTAATAAVELLACFSTCDIRNANIQIFHDKRRSVDACRAHSKATSVLRPTERCADVARIAAKGVAIDALCMEDTIRVKAHGIGDAVAKHKGKDKPVEVRA